MLFWEVSFMQVRKKWQIWPVMMPNWRNSYKKDILSLVKQIMLEYSKSKCNKILLIIRVWGSINTHPSIRYNLKYQTYLIYVLSKYVFRKIPKPYIHLI